MSVGNSPCFPDAIHLELDGVMILLQVLAHRYPVLLVGKIRLAVTVAADMPLRAAEARALLSEPHILSITLLSSSISISGLGEEA